MFIGTFITALLLLSGGSPQEPQDATLLGGPSLAEYEIPLDDWGGGGGGGSCGCKDTCDLAIIISDGKGGEIRCNNSGCRIQSYVGYKLLVCQFRNPNTNVILERSAGKC